MNQETKPNLDTLETELAIYYAAIGHMLDDCFKPGAGARMLGLAGSGKASYQLTDEIDVKATEIGKLLPVWERYAYEGILSAGYTVNDVDDCNDGPLERLRDMLNLLRKDDAYFETCLATVHTEKSSAPLGALQELVERTAARGTLDRGGELDAQALALLANMNERSVRNAMAGGDLKQRADGKVDAKDALEWLKGRRGFIETQHRALPQENLSVPDSLDGVELPPFIEQRLRSIWSLEAGDPAQDSWFGKSGYPGWIVAASKACDLPMDRLASLTHLPLSIRPGDCVELAKVLRVDRVWLTHQVMCALFPEQMDVLLNPSAWGTDSNPLIATATTVTITLTPQMLTHGYIDIPMAAKTLFPDDCFGKREEGATGASVTIHYGQHTESTDIRQKSAKTLSPRKRFTAWLNTELGARPGDRIRIEKTGEREYSFHHVAG